MIVSCPRVGDMDEDEPPPPQILVSSLFTLEMGPEFFAEGESGSLLMFGRVLGPGPDPGPDPGPREVGGRVIEPGGLPPRGDIFPLELTLSR